MDLKPYRGRPNEAPLPGPLAYFLTWPTHGTWLPGDERGWVKFKQGRQGPDPILKLEAAARMAEDACILDAVQRRLVESVVAEHCRIRGWTLYAVNCRSNHLHVVVAADRHPDEVREQLKAWCTRRLKALESDRLANMPPHTRRARRQWWAERGSKQYLNEEDSLHAAVRYVQEGQD